MRACYLWVAWRDFPVVGLTASSSCRNPPLIRDLGGKKCTELPLMDGKQKGLLFFPRAHEPRCCFPSLRLRLSQQSYCFSFLLHWGHFGALQIKRLPLSGPRPRWFSTGVVPVVESTNHAFSWLSWLDKDGGRTVRKWSAAESGSLHHLNRGNDVKNSK